MTEMSPKVDKEIYFRSGYLTPRRLASYGYQLQEVMKLQPAKMLEVGIGNGFLAYLLKNAGVALTTVDIDETLEPDIVASVADMPFEDKSFDLVACFETLEHMPYSEFKKALAEMGRVSKKTILISLPDAKSTLRIGLALKEFKIRRYLFDLPGKPVTHRFQGEHYWEVNKKKYPLARICDDIEDLGLVVLSTYRAWENPYHRFFRVAIPTDGGS